MGINKVILVGNVGKDPVVQYIKEDLPVARFSLATSETYRDKDGNKQTKTEWHNITVWRGLAKVVEQYVRKGNQLYIEGKITNRSYEKDGQTKYVTEIVASNMEMLGRADENKSNNTNTSIANSGTEDEKMPEINSNEAQTFDETDDLPF